MLKPAAVRCPNIRALPTSVPGEPAARPAGDLKDAIVNLAVQPNHEILGLADGVEAEPERKMDHCRREPERERRDQQIGIIIMDREHRLPQMQGVGDDDQVTNLATEPSPTAIEVRGVRTNDPARTARVRLVRRAPHHLPRLYVSTAEPLHAHPFPPS